MIDELDPGSAELQVGAVRVVANGPDQTILAFRFEDEDDFSSEMSLVFSAKGFAKTTRLFAVAQSVRDTYFDGKDLWVVDRHHVHRARGTLKKPAKKVLPGHVHVNAIAGTGAKDIYAVGEGVLHWNGKSWTMLAYEGGELSCAAAGKDAVYAAGEDGALVELRGARARALEAPEHARFESIFVSAAGELCVGGHRLALRGPPDALSPVKLPKKAEVVVGIAELAGKTYWATVGDGAGFGLFVQRRAKLELVDARIAGQLSASGRYLFVSGDLGALRFDGKDWKVLGLAWDGRKRRWNLVPGTLDDISEDEDQDQDH